MAVKHVDLFSGIGGFAIAAQRVGWETVAFCETDEFCRSVIERRFDRVRWVSLSGSLGRRPEEGTERFTELAGIDPDWLVIENVYQPWRRWVPELRRRLYALGYSSLPLRVRASEVGAVHDRARGWLVANADCEQLRELRWWFGWQGGACAAQLAEPWDSAPRGLGTDDGLPDWAHRRKALGNAIVPAAAELIFRGIEAVRKGLGADKCQR